ncbi:MAG: hypothetical protein ACI8Y4_002862 [Candidatus Poriferisodalaceae bacterium]|jgi:hypothetical protein
MYDVELRRRSPGWLVPLLLTGFPLWWALGLGELIFPIAGFAMAISLARTGPVLVPRQFGLYALFVVAVAASGLMLDRPSAALGWLTRLGQYAGVGMILPYVLTNRAYITPERLLRALTWLWIASVTGGVVALIVGPLSFPTPLSFILPSGIAENPFVREQVHPSFADVDGFLGFTSIRPKAPFTYTNGWGAALGLLFPVAVYASVRNIGVPRPLVAASLFLGAAPIVMSLNRGLWLSIIAGIAYGSLLVARRYGSRHIAVMLIAATVAAAIISVSPLGSLVTQRIDTGHSDEDRAELYVEVIDELKNSPFLGFGGPRQSEHGPPLGTHGQLWIVLFSNGLIGAALYFGFMGSVLIETAGGRTEAELVAHTVLTVGAIQVFFYGHVPQQLAILFCAMSVAFLARIRERGLITATSAQQPSPLKPQPIGTTL